MNIFGKIVAFLVALFVLTFAAVAGFVHYYVTDERVRAIVVPQAEKALGRQVTIGAIKIGIFSGITISDLTVKEQDQQNDFVTAGEFILSYDLMPLLQKKLVINEIRLNKPNINIIRDKNGKFNFNSLAVLAKTSNEPEKKKSEAAPEAVSLPVALIIENVKIVKGVLVIRDAKKEIPDTRVVTDLNISLDMADNLASLTFKGDLGMQVDIEYGELSPSGLVSVNFNQDKLGYQVDFDVDGEKIRLAGEVTQFLTGAPEIICNITSKQLDIDHLLALVEGLPKGDTPSTAAAPATTKTVKREPIAQAIPVGLVAHGLVAVDKAIYNKIAVNNFKLDYDLRKGIVTKKISANAVGGTLQLNTAVDLNEVDPVYKGDITAGSIDLKQLGKALGSDFTDVIAGSFQGKVNFNGSGIEPEVLKKNLVADATYMVSNGWIKGTQITSAIAQLTGLPELKEVAFQEMAGKVKLLKGGKVRLSTSMNAANLGMETEGEMDLDGNLNLPITLNLSPALTQKLDQKGSISKFLANDKGETELHLKVTGTTTKPKTSLDTSGMEKQIKTAVKTKAMEVLGGVLSGGQGKGGSSAADSPLGLFKGLMGQ